ncbi:MAG: DUF4058 family protein [Gemmataceae bacterium]|nr:DUF4058 family protein [Gemmataceae bacterium]
MPMHDWTRVPSGLFHHFHQFWAMEICRKLNRGRLPPGLSALVEQRKGPKETDVLTVELAAPDESTQGGTVVLERPKTRLTRQTDKAHYAEKADRIVIRHHLGRVVAFIEIVSPGNKDGDRALKEFVDKIAEAMEQGIHVLVLDLFPPTDRDPAGIHKAIWDQFDREDFELPANQDRVFVSYEADGVQIAHIETLGLGDPLPDMPLFIAAGAHVVAPLEDTYMSAWEDTPAAVRRQVVGLAPPATK